MDIKVAGVSYMTEVRTRNWRTGRFWEVECDRKLHLRDITLNVKPGTVSAFLGCGIGHKKLLECIALRQNEGFMSGSIQYDNSVRHSGAFRDIVFVSEMGGYHFDSLAVFDYLFFAAKLRTSHGNIECRERARVATKLVGLDGSAKIQSLSKTDLRLLTIAGELVGMPTLICILNPLEGLDAAGSIDVMHALYKVAKRQSTPTTVVYCVDGLNNDMLRYVDNVFVFNQTKLVQSIQVRDVDESIRSKVDNLIADISLQIMEYNEAEAVHKLRIRNATAIEKMSMIDEEFADEAVTDLIDKLSLDLTDLLCSVNSGGSQGAIVVNNSTVSNSGNTNVSDHLSRALSPTISYGGVNLYNEMDDNYLAFDRPNSLTAFAPDRALTTDTDGWSSLSVSSPMHGSSSGGRWQRLHSDVDGSTVLSGDGTDAKGQFRSNTRRRGDMGLPLRPMKPIWNEISILIMRSWKYHWKNRTLFRMSLFRYFFTGLIVGILAFNDGSYDKLNNTNLINDSSTGLENQSAYNVTSALFIIVSMSVIGCAFAVPYLHGNIKILKLEAAAGLHRSISSWISIVAVEIPAFILAAFCMAGLMHAMVNLHTSVQTFYGSAILVILVGYSLALSCSAWCDSVDTASFWFGVWSVICIVFTGYLQPIPTLPGMWPWACTASFTRWSFETMMISVYDKLSEGEDYLSTMYDFNNSNSTTPYLLWELIWLVSLQTIVAVALLPPAHNLQLIEFDSDHVRKFDVNELLSEEEERNLDMQGKSVKPLKGSMLSLADVEKQRKSTNKRSKQRHGGSELDENVSEAASAANTVSSIGVRDCADRFTVINLKASQQAFISFQRVRYELSYKDMRASASSGSATGSPASFVHSNSAHDYVIQNISGHAEPGNSLCILDGQNFGAGITLLQILAGRAPTTGRVSGTIRVNGCKLKRGMSYINAGYVQSGDIALVPCTVRECIRYAALLRRTDQKTCPMISHWMKSCFKCTKRRVCACFSRQSDGGEDFYRTLDAFDLIGMTGDVEERVDEVLKLMGLEDVSNTVILDSRNGNCNITPSQLRCLSIGIELVNRPGLVFLEDPVQGLDWCDADVVATAIQCLSQGGRTIIATLQTPSFRVHRTFSDTILIGSGLMLYCGITSKAQTYFDNIGFERSPDQNPLQYIMKIGGDMGVMKKTSGGRRAATLSPEDLADLCRSLNKIGGNKSNNNNNSNNSNNKTSSNRRVIGNSNNANASNDNDEDDDDFDASIHAAVIGISGNSNSNSNSNSTSKSRGSKSSSKGSRGSTNSGSSGNVELSNLITSKQFTISVGPITRVLAFRGFHEVFADKTTMLYFCLRYLAAGFLIGSVFYQISADEYQQRMSLFAITYFYVNVTIGDQLQGIHERKKTFSRERSSGASHFVAYWLADSIAVQTLHLIGALLFAVPLYTLSGLRPGFDYFGYFFLMIVLSSYCNLGLAYILSFFCQTAQTSQMIFNGILIPLQLLMSGYLFLLPTMASWYKWGSFICPMSYYLAGNFANEFDNNSHILSSTISFTTLSEQYDFNITKQQSFVALLAIGVVNHLIWLLLMKLFELSTKRDVFKRVIFARQRAKLILAAGIRVVNNSTASIRRGGASNNNSDRAFNDFGDSINSRASFAPSSSTNPIAKGSASNLNTTIGFSHANSAKSHYANAEEDAYIELESGSLHASYSYHPPAASTSQAATVGGTGIGAGIISGSSNSINNSSNSNTNSGNPSGLTIPPAATTVTLSSPSSPHQQQQSSFISRSNSTSKLSPTVSSLMGLSSPSTSVDNISGSSTLSMEGVSALSYSPNAAGEGGLLGRSSLVSLSPANTAASTNISPFLSRLPQSQPPLQQQSSVFANTNRTSLSAIPTTHPTASSNNNNNNSNTNNYYYNNHNDRTEVNDSNALIADDGLETSL